MYLQVIFLTLSQICLQLPETLYLNIANAYGKLQTAPIFYRRYTNWAPDYAYIQSHYPDLTQDSHLSPKSAQADFERDEELYYEWSNQNKFKQQASTLLTKLNKMRELKNKELLVILWFVCMLSIPGIFPIYICYVLISEKKIKLQGKTWMGLQNRFELLINYFSQPKYHKQE